MWEIIVVVKTIDVLSGKSDIWNAETVVSFLKRNVFCNNFDACCQRLQNTLLFKSRKAVSAFQL